MISLFIASMLSFADVKHYKLQLTPDNTVNYRGAVNSASVASVQQELIRLHKKRGSKKYKIYLVMDSPGGSVYDGLDFINFAKTIPNVDTISIFAASMGSAIVQGLPGKRYVTPTGIMMYHRAKGGFRGQFEDGEVEQQLKLWKAIVRGMESVSAARIGIPLKKYKALVKDEWWLYGEQNVKKNSADAIIHITCSQELIDAHVEKIKFGFFSKSVVKYSKCPLLRTPIR